MDVRVGVLVCLQIPYKVCPPTAVSGPDGIAWVQWVKASRIRSPLRLWDLSWAIHNSIDSVTRVRGLHEVVSYQIHRDMMVVCSKEANNWGLRVYALSRLPASRFYKYYWYQAGLNPFNDEKNMYISTIIYNLHPAGLTNRTRVWYPFCGFINKPIYLYCTSQMKNEIGENERMKGFQFLNFEKIGEAEGCECEARSRLGIWMMKKSGNEILKKFQEEGKDSLIVNSNLSILIMISEGGLGEAAWILSVPMRS